MMSRTFNFYFPNTGDAGSGNYSESYTYNEIGNIMSRNGVAYTYGAKPHAVTSVGSVSYTYDANGNMITRGDLTGGRCGHNLREGRTLFQSTSG